MNVKNASLIALSIAGPLSGAPALADTYTGCLTRLGVIVSVAPGDTPQCGTCPSHSTKITLGGSGGSTSGGVRDVELVNGYPFVNGVEEKTNPVEVPADGVAVSAECPAGKWVIGGGGASDNDAVVLNESSPDANGKAWNAFFVPADPTATPSPESYLHARAICATVDSYTLPPTP